MIPDDDPLPERGAGEERIRDAREEQRGAGEEGIREAREEQRGAIPKRPSSYDEFDEPERDIRRVRSKIRPEDYNHLKLLSIFHYIVAAIAMLCYSFPVFHLALGIGMVSGSFPGATAPPTPPPGTTTPGRPPPPGAAPPKAVGWIMIGGASAIILGGWLLAAGIAVAGWMLRRHRGYIFCLVMAGIACIFQPFGMILGIFTIIVLLRPGVKEIFGRIPSPTPGSA